MAKLNMVKALNLALMQEMERDDDVLVLGEDIGVDGGVFRVTDGLLAKFGEQRVIDLLEVSRETIDRDGRLRSLARAARPGAARRGA